MLPLINAVSEAREGMLGGCLDLLSSAQLPNYRMAGSSIKSVKFETSGSGFLMTNNSYEESE